METIKQKIINNNVMNPTSMDFDKSYVYNFIKRNSARFDKDSNGERYKSTLQNSFVINDWYKSNIETIERIINLINTTKSQLIDFICLAINHQYLYHNNRILGIENNLLNLYKDKFKSLDPNLDELETKGCLEGSVDGFAYLINYIEKCNFKFKLKDDFNFNESFYMNLFNVGILQQIIKDNYLNCIWNNRYITSSSNSITFELYNENEEKLIKVGQFRLEHETNETAKNTYINSSSKNTIFPEKLIKEGLKVTAECTNGNIDIKITKGFERLDEISKSVLKAALTTFYPFLNNVEVPNQVRLTFNDIILLYSIVKVLFQKIFFEFIKENGNKSSYSYSIIPTKIKRSKLVKYLFRKTHFDIQQIDSFLNLLSTSNNVNFWKTPFLLVDDYYICPLLPILETNPVYQIESFLENSGFEMKLRGKYFENFLKAELNEIFKERDYDYFIPKTKKFKAEFNKEEVDLIINLKSIIIIAEVKCLKLPIEVVEKT